MAYKNAYGSLYLWGERKTIVPQLETLQAQGNFEFRFEVLGSTTEARAQQGKCVMTPVLHVTLSMVGRELLMSPIIDELHRVSTFPSAADDSTPVNPANYQLKVEPLCTKEFHNSSVRILGFNPSIREVLCATGVHSVFQLLHISTHQWESLTSDQQQAVCDILQSERVDFTPPGDLSKTLRAIMQQKQHV